MTGRYTEFKVDLTGKSPRNLQDSIRGVRNASAGFVQSVLSGDHKDALETSQDAFEHLDYIQNELLRQRDQLKANAATWPASPFKTALSIAVGRLLNDVTPADRAWFLGLPEGSGAIPPSALPVPLTLEKALNKLKHRDTVAINFSVRPPADHRLYIFSNAGMGMPDSISEIDVIGFCSACRSAAEHV